MPEGNAIALEVNMEGLREIFKIKLCREFLQFKESMLGQDREELFNSCYKIDVYRNFYEIILALAVSLPEEQLEALYGKSDILEGLYRGWVKVEDSYFLEIQQYVENKILQTEMQGKDGETNGGAKECPSAECGRD